MNVIAKRLRFMASLINGAMASREAEERSLGGRSVPPSTIGARIPEFGGRSTMCARRLNDYRDCWLVFLFQPADFNAVYSSDFVDFARAYDAFLVLDCDQLALLIDCLFGHLTLAHDIERSFGVRLSFPVVEDTGFLIGRAYSAFPHHAMSSAAVRAVFVIDPSSIVRAVFFYPLTVGRSVAEIMRLVAGTQEADRTDTETPEGWRPGNTLLAPPPVTASGVARVEALSVASFCCQTVEGTMAAVSRPGSPRTPSAAIDPACAERAVPPSESHVR